MAQLYYQTTTPSPHTPSLMPYTFALSIQLAPRPEGGGAQQEFVFGSLVTLLLAGSKTQEGGPPQLALRPEEGGPPQLALRPEEGGPPTGIRFGKPCHPPPWWSGCLCADASTAVLPDSNFIPHTTQTNAVNLPPCYPAGSKTQGRRGVSAATGVHFGSLATLLLGGLLDPRPEGGGVATGVRFGSLATLLLGGLVASGSKTRGRRGAKGVRFGSLATLLLGGLVACVLSLALLYYQTPT
eukprot:gene22278-29354_t